MPPLPLAPGLPLEPGLPEAGALAEAGALPLAGALADAGALALAGALAEAGALADAGTLAEAGALALGGATLAAAEVATDVAAGPLLRGAVVALPPPHAAAAIETMAANAANRHRDKGSYTGPPRLLGRNGIDVVPLRLLLVIICRTDERGTRHRRRH